MQNPVKVLFVFDMSSEPYSFGRQLTRDQFIAGLSSLMKHHAETYLTDAFGKPITCTVLTEEIPVIEEKQ